MKSVIGKSADEWLRSLPRLVSECETLWSCAFSAPYRDLSFNYVASGSRFDGQAVVLKLCIPNDEYLTEAGALQAIAGDGANLLLACDHPRHALLLERLIPGRSLDEMADHDQADQIAASVMKRIWRINPDRALFPSVNDWIQHMADRKNIVQGTVFPTSWITTALGMYHELISEPAEQLLLHGDLHKGNILSSQREPWLAIDPKGVIGPAIWETGPLLLNVINPGESLRVTRHNLFRSVLALSSALGHDRRRIAAWGVVRAVLSAFWTVEDHGHDWQSTLLTAEILQSYI